jgi:hypothetical protein
MSFYGCFSWLPNLKRTRYVHLKSCLKGFCVSGVWVMFECLLTYRWCACVCVVFRKRFADWCACLKRTRKTCFSQQWRHYFDQFSVKLFKANFGVETLLCYYLNSQIYFGFLSFYLIFLNLIIKTKKTIIKSSFWSPNSIPENHLKL